MVEVILMLRLAAPLRTLVRRAADGLAAGSPGSTAARTASGSVRPAEGRDSVADDVVEFLRGRLRASLIDRGLRYDVVDASLAVSGDDLLAAAGRAEAVAGVVGEEQFAALYVGFDRASRIVTAEAAETVDPALFEAEAERALLSAITQVRAPVTTAAARGEFRAAMEGLRPLVAPVNRIFDDVLIMAPDPRVRANRLALLREAAETFRLVADFSTIVMTDEVKRTALSAAVPRGAGARE
jgi:glycyl-tRNA synthetase beta chain